MCMWQAGCVFCGSGLARPQVERRFRARGNLLRPSQKKVFTGTLGEVFDRCSQHQPIGKSELCVALLDLR